jgi:hypothetical protein
MADSSEQSNGTNSLERHTVPNVHNPVQHLDINPPLGKQCEATFSRPPQQIYLRQSKKRPDRRNEEGIKSLAYWPDSQSKRQNGDALIPEDEFDTERRGSTLSIVA